MTNEFVFKSLREGISKTNSKPYRIITLHDLNTLDNLDFFVDSNFVFDSNITFKTKVLAYMGFNSSKNLILKELKKID